MQMPKTKCACNHCCNFLARHSFQLFTLVNIRSRKIQWQQNTQLWISLSFLPTTYYLFITFLQSLFWTVGACLELSYFVFISVQIYSATFCFAQYVGTAICTLTNCIQDCVHSFISPEWERYS